ncbi:hypothetical protein GO986_19390 [Deinococcus sp. HMF7620]|uniref:DUF7674 domain-containing protein n=1 Tax=Deinococcus arboris TaxID=2682977 RepID=A0A7C9I179_9DEIO|nr:hypothetical protein [Deinococcus arboris]MVN88910.1 hypothetical protein [Deinococcus arboris]
MSAVIDATHLQFLILQLIPEFEVDDERTSKGRPPSEAWLFMHLLDVVDPWVRAGDEARIQPIFALIERCQIEGTTAVANEACTCFLESLSNRLLITA